MTFIIEDGTIVTNANSYVTLAEIKAYAVARNITLGTDPVIESQSVLAVDYLESKRTQYQGSKVSELQELQFPRYNVKIDGFDIAETSIPNNLKKAQCQLIVEQANGGVLMPTQLEAAVKKEVVGPIETEYAVSVGAINQPVFSAVDALLEPLFNTSSGFSLTTVRI